MAPKYRIYPLKGLAILNEFGQMLKQRHQSLRRCSPETVAFVREASGGRGGVRDRFLTGVLANVAYITDVGVSVDDVDRTTMQVMLMESWAWCHKFPTVFVEDPELIDLVWGSKFEVDSEVFRIPFPGRSAMFTFPAEARLEGQPVDGVLFGEYSSRELVLNMLNLVHEWHKRGYVKDLDTVEWLRGHFKSGAAEECNDNPHIYVAFSPPPRRDRIAPHYKAAIPKDWIGPCLNHPGYLDQVLTPESYFMQGREVPERTLNGEESERVRKLARLCAGLCVYACAYPEAVVDGLPDGFRLRDLCQDKAHPKACFRLTAPRCTRTGVKLHIRKSHFRWLRHECFQRDKDGNVRCIWVREAVVGGEITPKTLRKTPRPKTP